MFDDVNNQENGQENTTGVHEEIDPKLLQLMGEVNNLTDQLRSTKEELKDISDKLKYKELDMERLVREYSQMVNALKNEEINKEKKQMQKIATIINDTLQTIMNLEKYVNTDLLDALIMTKKNLINNVKNTFNIMYFVPEIGEVFDFTKHESVTYESNPALENHIITNVFSGGFMYNDQVLIFPKL